MPNAENRELVGILGDAVEVTVWRRLRRVVMSYGLHGRTVHTHLSWSTINRLEKDIADLGWSMKLENGCRTVWVRPW